MRCANLASQDGVPQKSSKTIIIAEDLKKSIQATSFIKNNRSGLIPTTNNKYQLQVTTATTTTTNYQLPTTNYYDYDCDDDYYDY